MSYSANESSIDSGRPIELYHFSLGGNNWFYTSADQDVVFDDVTYLSAKISGTEVRQTGEYVNDALQIEVPVTIAPAQLFMTAAPSYAILINISYIHLGDTEKAISYQGEVVNANFPTPGRAVLTCESIAATMRREGLRLAWQRSCPYALYDPVTCKLNKAAWAVNFTVLTINGFTLTVDLATVPAEGHFDGGFIEWAHPIRGIEFLSVETHTAATGEANATLVLFGPPGELFEGARGQIYPGCNFTPDRCQFFGNYDNYGGHPDMPGKSPFDNNPFF